MEKVTGCATDAGSGAEEAREPGAAPRVDAFPVAGATVSLRELAADPKLDAVALTWT